MGVYKYKLYGKCQYKVKLTKERRNRLGKYTAPVRSDMNKLYVQVFSVTLNLGSPFLELPLHL